jgi:Restriction endonuclease
LEALVGRLFRSAHFRIERNPGLARPRQTDLLAEGGGATFLIETKWRKQPATVADVDALRGRLDRSQSGVIGVLISLSGFTATALTAVLERRDRPVLLLDRADLERACIRDFDLRRMLRIKQDALRLQAEVLVGSQEPPFQRPATSSDLLVDGDALLLTTDGTRVPWVAAGGSFSAFTFSRGLNDPDWVSAPGAGVTFDLPLSVQTVDGMVHALGELSSLGWATGAGTWSIAQSETNWHGIGPASLAQALLCWRDRYEGAGSLHHTE